MGSASFSHSLGLSPHCLRRKKWELNYPISELEQFMTDCTGGLLSWIEQSTNLLLGDSWLISTNGVLSFYLTFFIYFFIYFYTLFSFIFIEEIFSKIFSLFGNWIILLVLNKKCHRNKKKYIFMSFFMLLQKRLFMFQINSWETLIIWKIFKCIN